MKKLGLVLLSILGMVYGAVVAEAQDKFPSKPIRFILPYGPGTATDITTRVMCEQMRQILGQSCVVDNKPGAFGILAIEEMARSRPDGYTLQVGNVSTNAITPVLFAKKFKINYMKDVVADLAACRDVEPSAWPRPRTFRRRRWRNSSPMPSNVPAS